MQAHSSNLTDWAAERQFLGRFYQSQGLRDSARVTNDCGPTSLAVVLNILSFQANLNAPQMDKKLLLGEAGLRFWQRLPDWVPSVGGATAPWGMAAAFNRWAEKIKLEWRAERHSHARRAHVIEHLMNGRPVTALKIWKNGGAHWVNLVRYSTEKDRLYFLDPNPWLENLPPEKRLQSQIWADFETEWSRRCWWSHLLGIHNEIIVYSRFM